VKQYVGLDVSQKVSSVCVIDELGRKVWTGKCASTPESIAATLADRAPQVERVGLETGPLCVWHYHGLKAISVPVLCLDARHAKAALSMQVNKTDDNDAEGLAKIVRTGWYREVFVKSFEAQRRRSLPQSRAVLVSMRREPGNDRPPVQTEIDQKAITLTKGPPLDYATPDQHMRRGGDWKAAGGADRGDR